MINATAHAAAVPLSGAAMAWRRIGKAVVK